MTSHYFIASIKPIPEFHSLDNNYAFLSDEAYKERLPFTLPYVYEFGGETVEFLSFLDEFMDLGDSVKQYIFEEGRNGISLSGNYLEEARKINLVKRTYKDQIVEYQLSKKKWKEELAKRTLASKRSVTTFVKY